MTGTATASFLNENFLLETGAAADLYHGFARNLPIVDYHCHLSPELMAADHRFRSITEIWLDGDHYKWRAMRACGVPERLITGDASDWEKFEAWARTVPMTLMNPLYHWTAMELKRPFGINELLSPASAHGIFDTCNSMLASRLSAMEILRQFRVAVVCTTDDPTDTLEAHRRLAARLNPDTCVYPTWRPDKALAIDDVADWSPRSAMILPARVLTVISDNFSTWHSSSPQKWVRRIWSFFIAARPPYRAT
jgi:glucuronate isomerase